MSFLESILASLAAGIILMLLLAVFTPGGEAFVIGNPIRRLLLWALTSKAGLMQIYRKSTGLHRRIAKELMTSKNATLLQIRGQEFLTTGTQPILRSAFSTRINHGLNTRVLLLNPSSPYVRARAKEVSFNSSALKNGIKASLEELQSKCSAECKLYVRVHNENPLFCIYMFDNRIYLSFYLRGIRRQESPVLELGSDTMLYQAFSGYCEWIWSDRSEALEERGEYLEKNQYHYEIEEKVRVLDREKLVDQIVRFGARLDREVIYRDHYFVLQQSPEIVAGGEEIRIRCDLGEGKIYRTHKLPFNAPNNASKRQRETCVGLTHEFELITEGLNEEGLIEAVRFWKHCSNYNLRYQAQDIQLTIAYISSGIAKADDLRSQNYLELEILLSEDASSKEIRESYSAILNLLRRLVPNVSGPTEETYIGVALGWPGP